MGMDYPWKNQKYEVYMLPDSDDVHEMSYRRVRMCQNSKYVDEGTFYCYLRDCAPIHTLPVKPRLTVQIGDLIAIAPI